MCNWGSIGDVFTSFWVPHFAGDMKLSSRLFVVSLCAFASSWADPDKLSAVRLLVAGL